MVNGMRHVLFYVAICLTLGSCGSCLCGSARNVEGDGVSPSQTLTATVLGFERGDRCHRLDYEDDVTGWWDCEIFASHLSPIWWRSGGWDETGRREEWPVASFVAQWMLAPVEWLICLWLFLLSLPPVKKQEKAQPGPTA